jgi:hypothetical protein
LLCPQPAPSAGIEFFDPKFLGPAMPLVEILRHSFEAGTVTQRLPTRGLVRGGLEILPIHEALDQDNGVIIVRLPILREAFEVQAQGVGSQIGKLLPSGQNDKATVLGQQR